jgi:pimeloyl-ACP methyl ester carboxylesterase
MDNPQTKISEKQIQINGLNINYKTIGDGKIPIVLLHGWGVSSDKYTELIKILYSILLPAGQAGNTQYSILILDLPGFGKSDEPSENWKLDDYVEFVEEFIEKTNRKGGFELVKDLLKNLNLSKGLASVTTGAKPMRKSILIGHSFGGRIAIKYAVKYPEKIEKLILTGAAGIKHSLILKQKIFYIAAKTGKSFFSLPLINNLEKYAQKILYKAAREKDYYQASSRMKEVMKNVLDEDLTDYLDKIKNPALLVWGREDKTTPLVDGEIMNEKIKNSELKVVDDANHSLPYQKPEEFARIVNSTLTNTD